MADLIALAEALAHRLHAGQVDKRGEPYIDHLSAVVGILLRRWPDAPAEVVAAAWLHDAIEDTGATRASLVAAGLPLALIAIVEEVTRPAALPYLAWIARLAVSGSRGALMVKLADNEHNSAPSRWLPGSDIVERRYRPARFMLETELSKRLDPPPAPVMVNGVSCPWPQCGLKGACAHADLCGQAYDPEEG